MTTPAAHALHWTSADPEAASGVLMAAARSVLARGHEELWPLETLTPDALALDYPADGWQVAWQGGQAVGCFVLMDPDPVFWADKPPGEALYLHKLAVHPQGQGQALAPKLLAHAGALTHAASRRWLRLDTDVTRPGLQAIYSGCGFLAVDRRKVLDFEVFRYEKEVG